MCYASSCNPTCGKCYPKKIVEVICPECGSPSSVRRESYLIDFDLPHKASIMEKKMIERGDIDGLLCSSCGTDLRETYRAAVPPEPCTRSQVICGFPCGMRTEPHRKGVPPCQYMVPIGELEE